MDQLVEAGGRLAQTYHPLGNFLTFREGSSSRKAFFLTPVGGPSPVGNLP